MAPWQSFSISLENDCNNDVGVKLCKRRETWEWAVMYKSGDSNYHSFSFCKTKTYLCVCMKGRERSSQVLCKHSCSFYSVNTYCTYLISKNILTCTKRSIQKRVSFFIELLLHHHNSVITFKAEYVRLRFIHRKNNKVILEVERPPRNRMWNRVLLQKF